MLGAAESASLRDVAPLNAALPGSSGGERPCAAQLWHCQVYLAAATQLWHCQCFLAWKGPSPPGIGTAKDYWPGKGFRR